MFIIMLDHTRIRAVNIDGTDHVIRACRENNVSSLVYVSTYNGKSYGYVIGSIMSIMR